MTPPVIFPAEPIQLLPIGESHQGRDIPATCSGEPEVATRLVEGNGKSLPPTVGN